MSIWKNIYYLDINVLANAAEEINEETESFEYQLWILGMRNPTLRAQCYDVDAMKP